MTRTAAQIIERVRLQGDYQNADGDYSDTASHLSSGTMLAFLDDANRYVHDLYAQTDQEFKLTRTTYSVTAGTSEYSLPADFSKLRAVEVAADGGTSGWLPLTRANLDDNSYPSSGRCGPYTYRLLSGSFELLPAPAESTTVRFSYVPEPSRITSTSDTIDDVNGYDQVVADMVLIACRMREGQDFSDVQLRLNDRIRRFEESIRRRDRAMPRRMRPRPRRGIL